MLTGKNGLNKKKKCCYNNLIFSLQWSVCMWDTPQIKFHCLYLIKRILNAKYLSDGTNQPLSRYGICQNANIVKQRRTLPSPYMVCNLSSTSHQIRIFKCSSKSSITMHPFTPPIYIDRYKNVAVKIFLFYINFKALYKKLIFIIYVTLRDKSYLNSKKFRVYFWFFK